MTWWQALRRHFGRNRALLILGEIVLLTVFLGQVAGITNFIDRLWYDSFERVRQTMRPGSGGVVVVGIDRQTLDEVKQSWPWSRELTASLLHKIKELSPRAVVVDMLFQHPGEAAEEAGDASLEQALQTAGNVGLIYLLEQVRTREGLRVQQFRSIERFRRHAGAEGFVWGVVDSDRRIRSVVLRDSRFDEDSIVLSVLRQASRPIPWLPRPDWEGLVSTFVSFPRPGAIPVISAGDILGNRVVPELREKIVVVGCTAPEAKDWHPTTAGRIPGSYLLAAAFDTVLDNRLLGSAPSFQQSLVWTIGGMMLGVSILCVPHGLLFLPLIIGIGGLGSGTLLLSSGVGYVLPVGALLVGFLGTALSLIFLRLLTDFLSYQAVRNDAAGAGVVQNRLLPPSSWSEGEYEWAGICRPCEAAGGDYLDFHGGTPGRLLFCLSDVSGHGYTAAMVTTVLKGVFAVLRHQADYGPIAMIAAMNRRLFRLIQRKKLATMVVGQVETGLHRVTLAAAGHLPAYHRSGKIVAEVGLPSSPMGLRAELNPKFEREIELPLAPGDFLVFYSDGIPEALNLEDRQFGFPRLAGLINGMTGHESAQDIVQAVFQAVDTFAAGRPNTDDVTVMVLRRRGVHAV